MSAAAKRQHLLEKLMKLSGPQLTRIDSLVDFMIDENQRALD